VLRVLPLTDAEYTISAVAEGVEEYYLGHGEAPGVWSGRWRESWQLSGVVGHQDLRPLVEGHHPETGTDLLAGRPGRKDMAFDATFSAPKSVSLLWAFGTPHTSSVVVRAHVEAVEQALGFVEERAAVAPPAGGRGSWPGGHPRLRRGHLRAPGKPGGRSPAALALCDPQRRQAARRKLLRL